MKEEKEAKRLSSRKNNKGSFTAAAAAAAVDVILLDAAGARSVHVRNSLPKKCPMIVQPLMI